MEDKVLKVHNATPTAHSALHEYAWDPNIEENNSIYLDAINS